MKIINVIQESIVDGERFINVTPCKDEDTAKKVIEDELKEVLSNGKYKKLVDLCPKLIMGSWDNMIDLYDEDDNYSVIFEEDSIFLKLEGDDYSEKFIIDKKEVVGYE